jgi:hypothetical protein
MAHIVTLAFSRRLRKTLVDLAVTKVIGTTRALL